jgi:histidyl-tRNA synthetase
VVGAQSTIGGGGRYDGLAEQLGGRPTPGVGFASGVKRIILEIKDQQVRVPASPAPTVFLVYQAEGGKLAAFRLAEELRAQGISADLSYGDRKLGKQLAAADRSGAQFAVVLGEDELASGTVSLKDLRSGGGVQRRVDRQQLVSVLRQSDAATQ